MYLSFDSREVSLMKSKSVEIKKDSLRVLDEAHVQCEKKIEMGETRAEKLVNRLREECQMLQGDIISVHQSLSVYFVMKVKMRL